MNSIPSDLVSEIEASSILQISSRTLTAWRHRKSGPRYYKFQRMVRYSKADLEAVVLQALVQHGPAVSTPAEDSVSLLERSRAAGAGAAAAFASYYQND